MKIRYSARALADVRQIHGFLFDRSPIGARHVLEKIKAAIDLLGEMPLSGRSTDIHSVRTARVMRYPYRIFYRIEGGTVQIVHIRHTARRQPKGLHEQAQAAFG